MISRAMLWYIVCLSRCIVTISYLVQNYNLFPKPEFELDITFPEVMIKYLKRFRLWISLLLSLVHWIAFKSVWSFGLLRNYSKENRHFKPNRNRHPIKKQYNEHRPKSKPIGIRNFAVVFHRVCYFVMAVHSKYVEYWCQMAVFPRE